MRDAIYIGLWSFIALVSTIDTYLCVRYAESLVAIEQNPVCQWLLAINGVPILIALKFLGTSIVLGYLLAMRRHWTAMPVIGGVSLFQVLLLLYLSMYLP